MATIQTSSGATAVVNPASFMEAMALKNAVQAELTKGDAKLAGALGGGAKTLESMEVNLYDLAKLAFLVDSSQAVQDALFRCLGRCTYNGQRITQNTFEDVSAREDYYEIAVECLKANIGPFLKGLLSKLMPLLGKLGQASITHTQQSATSPDSLPTA